MFYFGWYTLGLGLGYIAMGGCPWKDCKNRKYHRRTEYLDTESSFHLYPVLLCNFLKYILGYKSEMGGSSCQVFKFTVELRLRGHNS